MQLIQAKEQKQVIRTHFLHTAWISAIANRCVSEAFSQPLALMPPNSLAKNTVLIQLYNSVDQNEDVVKCLKENKQKKW